MMVWGLGLGRVLAFRGFEGRKSRGSKSLGSKSLGFRVYRVDLKPSRPDGLKPRKKLAKASSKPLTLQTLNPKPKP